MNGLNAQNDSAECARKSGSGDSMKAGMRPFDLAQDRLTANGNNKRGAGFCVALCALLFALSFSAQAQQSSPKVPRIGFLGNFGSPDASSVKHQLDAFRQGLKDVGYVEGKNILIEYRHPKENPEQAPELAAELVRLKVDVVVAVDPTAIAPPSRLLRQFPLS